MPGRWWYRFLSTCLLISSIFLNPSLLISLFASLPFRSVRWRDLLIWCSSFLRWRITKCWNLLPLSDMSSISMRGGIWEGGGRWTAAFRNRHTEKRGFSLSPKLLTGTSHSWREGDRETLAVSMFFPVIPGRIWLYPSDFTRNASPYRGIYTAVSPEDTGGDATTNACVPLNM